jgi:hypothetical protein
MSSNFLPILWISFHGIFNGSTCYYFCVLTGFYTATSYINRWDQIGCLRWGHCQFMWCKGTWRT